MMYFLTKFVQFSRTKVKSDDCLFAGIEAHVKVVSLSEREYKALESQANADSEKCVDKLRFACEKLKEKATEAHEARGQLHHCQKELRAKQTAFNEAQQVRKVLRLCSQS